VELIVSNSAERAFGVELPTCIPLVLVELGVHDGVEGAFDVGPPAHTPNIVF
jgi:hypothetical protein